MRTRPVLTGAALTALVLIVSACGDSGSSTGSSSSGDAPGGLLAVPSGCTPVKIGGNWEQTGAYAVYGIAFQNGMTLGVRDVNSAGGFDVGGKKYCFEAKMVDSRSDVSVAVANTRSLITGDKVAAVFGPAVDSETIKTQVVSNAARTIMFGPSSILDEALIGNAQKGGKAHYLFKSSSAADVREGATATAAKKLLPDVKTVALLNPKDVAGTSIGDSEVKWIEKQGWQVVQRIEYPVGTTDWSSFLSRIKTAKPDLLWVNYIPNDTLTILKQASALKVAPNYSLFSVDPSSYVTAFPKGIPDAKVFMSCNPLCPHGPNSPIPEADRAPVAKFWKAWQDNKFAYTPGTSTATLAYDYVFMLAQAMTKAGTVSEADPIVDALEQVRLDGVLSSDLRFDENHVAVHDWDVCLAEGVKFTCETGKAPTG